MALFTSTSRLMRPVRQAKGGALELVGPLEQVSLRIRCPDGGAVEGAVFSHEEIDPTAMLSIVASLTPYSDFNQSPRNMYQCQMGKQTMGSPVHVRQRVLLMIVVVGGVGAEVIVVVGGVGAEVTVGMFQPCCFADPVPLFLISLLCFLPLSSHCFTVLYE